MAPTVKTLATPSVSLAFLPTKTILLELLSNVIPFSLASSDSGSQYASLEKLTEVPETVATT